MRPLAQMCLQKSCPLQRTAFGKGPGMKCSEKMLHSDTADHPRAILPDKKGYAVVVDLRIVESPLRLITASNVTWIRRG